MNKSTNSAATALLALSLTGVLLAVGQAQDRGQRPRTEPASASEQAGSFGRRVGRRQPMSAEEKLIRNAYLKLMRYQSAGLDELAATSRKEIQPEDYLRFELRDIHTCPIEEISSRPLSEIVTPPGGYTVRLKENHLVWGNGPAHAYYEAEWGTEPEGQHAHENTTEQEKQRVRKSGDWFVGVQRYTTYQVTVLLGGKHRLYRAIALHHGKSEAGENRSEIIDNVTSEMNTLLAEESPRVRSPWKTYIKSNLYLAVVKAIGESERKGRPLIPPEAPPGYLPGDDAKPDSDSQTIAAVCPPTTVDILQDGTVITNTTRNVIVGQKISLTIAVSPSGTTTKPQWTIPGTRIANYIVQYTSQIAPTSAVVTSLTNLKTTSIEFYWVDGADSRQVTFSCNVDGQSYTAQATFNVKRPTATFTSTSGASVAMDSACNGFLNLHYGCSADSFGVRFSTTSLVIPSGFSGDTLLVQLVDSTTRTRVKINGTTQTQFGTGLLDTTFPYGLDWDAPGQPLDPDEVRVTANDSFTMYLIFKPSTPNSIWVPLRKLSWSWSGDGLYNGTLNSSSHSPNQTGVDAIDHPQWSANATSLSFH